MNPSTKRMQKNFSIPSLMAVVGLTGSALCLPAHGQSFELPAMKVVQAPLVSPSSAITYYGSGTTHSYSLPSVQANATSGIRPVEIKELAKGLGATQIPASLTQDQYAQRVFEYVRQNIAITFMYGLQRGALGALINQSGTAFDQAQLMVELLREGGITGANYEVGTITLTAAQFTAWTGISNAAAACRLLADGGIPGTVNGSSDPNCGMTGSVSSITLRHAWVTALSKKYDPAYKTHTTKTAIDLAAAMGCGTASAPTCKADVQTALTSGAVSGVNNGVDYYQNLNATAFNTKLKSLATTLQTTLKQTYPNALIEDVIGGKAIDFTTLPTPGATLPYSSITSTAAWTEIPDQYRVKLRVNFDNIAMNTTNVAVPHNEFYVDELYGKRLYLMGSIDPNNFAIRKTMLFVDHELVAQSTRNDASVDNDTLSLTANHPYAANSGAYLDEQTILPTNAHVVNGYSWFYPTTILHEWGAVGTGRMSYAQAKENRDGYLRNFTNPYGLLYDHDCTHASQPPSMVIGTRSTAGGIPFGEVFGCLQMHQVSHLANWSVQNGRVQEVIGQINASNVLLQHAVGFMTSGAENNGTVSIASSVSVISRANTATDRQAAAWSLAALSAHLESQVFQQGQSTWEAESPVSLWVRSNEKGHSFLLATPGNLNTVLAQTQNYPDSVKQRMTTYATQGASTILPSNWYPGIFFPEQPFPVGINSNGYLVFQPSGAFMAHLTGVLGLKGGLGTASPDPARDIRESVQQMDGSLKTRKYYGVDLGQGQLTLSPPADLVTGTGGFPKSLEFKRLYSSSSDPLSHSMSTITPLPCGTPGCGPPPGGASPEYFSGDSQQWLPGGWDFSLHVRATVGSDALQSLGADSAIDASSTIAAFYVLREVNRSLITTPQQAFLPQLTTAFGTYWWGTTLIDSAVVVRRPPVSDTFMRLPDGTLNPPPNSADVLVQFNTRAGPTSLEIGMTWRDLTYNYSPVTWSLTDRNGSTVNFAWQGVEKAGRFGTRPSRLFDAVSWSFPDGARVDYEYTNFTMCDPGALVSPSAKRLTAIRNNLGRRLEFTGFDTAANGSGPASCNPYHPYVVKDETNRAVTVTLETSPTGSPSVAVNTTDAGNTVVSTTRYDYLTTANDPTAARVGMMIDSWFTPTDVYPTSPLAKVQYDKLLRVASLDSAANNAAGTRPRTDYLIGGLSLGEQLHRGESIDPLGAHNTTYFDKFGKDVQHIDPLGRITWKTYDSRQRLKSVILPEGNSTEYTYDIRSNVLMEKQLPKPTSAWAATTITKTYPEGTNVFPCVNLATCNQVQTSTDKKGRITDYGYYTNGQIKQVKGPTVGTERSESDYCYANYTTSTGPLSLLTGAVNVVGGGKPNRVSIFYYDSANKFLLQSATVDPTNSLTPACAGTIRSGAKNLTSTFTFDAVGNVSTIDGPRTDVSDLSTYTFDPMRRLKQVDGPSGTNVKTIYTYFDDGTLRYTDKQEMVSGSPVLRREERAYWPSGDLKSVKDPEGNITQTNYDLAGRANLTTDPDGRRTGTAYDLAGQTRCVWKNWNSTTAPGLVTTLNSSACDWIPADYIAAGNDGRYRYVAYTYTLNGKQATIQDADANQTDLVYDKHDRLRYTLFPSPSTGNRCTAATSENVTALTCPTGATYEELRYSTSGAPAANATALCSGSDQVCAKRTRANQVIAYTYDTMNRVSTKAAPGLPTVTSTYNLLSEPLSLASPSQTSPAIPLHNVTYDYNDVGQKLFEKNTLTVNTVPTVRQVSYAYDQAGNRISTTWPDGYLVSYEYDALNRMIKVWEGNPPTGTPPGIKLADYTYDELSRRKDLMFSNQPSNKVTYAYELDNNLNILTNVLNSVTVTLDYGHNYSGQITTIDANDRFYLPSKAIQTTTAYVPNKLNQYDTVGGQAQTYDSNGNLLTWFPTGGKHTYTYDSENRLRSAAINGSPTASIAYDYDALGRRLSKTVGGTSTYYLLDGDEEIAEYSSGGAVLRRYITGPAVDDRIAHIEGTGGSAVKTFYHVNHQGSVIAMTDSTGTITQKLAYDEYGLLTSDSPASTTGEQFRYTGRRYDDETKLYYYRARYYSPVLGRFLQTDPVGYKDDFNLYAYVGNDPANKTDPTGMEGEDANLYGVQSAKLTVKGASDFEAKEKLEEVVVTATKPKQKQAAVAPAIPFVDVRPIVFPVIRVTASSVAATIIGVLFPSNTASDDTCDNGQCFQDDEATEGSQDDNGTESRQNDNVMESRRDWVPNKPGRKKQGREAGEKKRGKGSWKPRNPPREPPKHTPSQKD